MPSDAVSLHAGKPLPHPSQLQITAQTLHATHQRKQGHQRGWQAYSLGSQTLVTSPLGTLPPCLVAQGHEGSLRRGGLKGLGGQPH